MYTKFLALCITLLCCQLYPDLEQHKSEQPNFEQPEFKDSIHLFSKRNLVEELKLEEELSKKMTAESERSAIVSFLNAKITSEAITQTLKGPQIPEIGYHPKRKKVYSGELAQPTHLVLTFSGKPTLQETIETLKKNRLAHNFIINTDGSIHPITSEGESIEDALKYRPFALGIAGKTIDGEYEERDMNAISITISVVGLDTKTATEEQEQSLIKLVGWLKNKFKIKSYNVVDYGTIAFPYGRRKTQENLPWKKLAEQGLTIWPKDRKFKNKFDYTKTKYVIFISAALKKIGYITPITTNKDLNSFKLALITFQKHYKCENNTGEITDEVLAKIIDIIKQMEDENPQLKHIWPPAKLN